MSALSPITISVQSGELAVRDALSQLLKGLDPLDLSAEESGTLELVLAEALNNIVEHAYATGEEHGRIEIGCEHQPDGLHFRIRDFGKKMPNGAMPIGRKHNLDVEINDLPEGGFGWFLIQDLAKDVAYQRVGGTNELVLRLAVGFQ